MGGNFQDSLQPLLGRILQDGQAVSRALVQPHEYGYQEGWMDY